MKKNLIILLMIFSISEIKSQISPMMRLETKSIGSKTSSITQPMNIVSSADIQVYPSFVNQTEFSIAVNPKNQNNILIGANTDLGPGYYYSTNSGLNWQGDDLLPGVFYGGDPTVAFDSNGYAFYCYLEDVSEDIWKLRVRKSTTGGATWQFPVEIPNVGDPDKPHMAIDIYNRNYIYTAYTDFSVYYQPIKFFRSIDGGVSFSNPREIGGSPSYYMCQGVNLATGPNGELYAAWAIYSDWGEGFYGEDGIGFNRSTDGGTNWNGPWLCFDIYGTRGMWYHKNPQGDGIRVNSFPSMAVDNSGGPDSGTIYIVWTDIRNGDPDILLSKSTNNGVNWSNPMRVNQDVIGNGKDQWFPWITVNPDGILNIVFYDSRNDPNNQLTETWVAQSIDGGATFKDYKASDIAFIPYPIPGYDVGYMGDYIGIASTREYSFPCWMSNHRDSLYQAYIDRFGSYKIVGSLSDRWNMVSVPIVAHNFAKSAVWATSISAAFGYQGIYVVKDTLKMGSGYWVKFNGAQSIAYVGEPRDTLTIPVTAGWNMIGSISQPLQTTKITTSPTGIIASKYFGYNGAYYETQTIEPGKAYWIKMSQAGTLYLDINSTANTSPSSSTEQPPAAPGPPPTPTLSGSTVLAGGEPHPQLTWTSSGSDITYKLYRYTCSGTVDCGGSVAHELIYQGSGLSYIDMGVIVKSKLPTHRAYYYVNATNIFGETSANSNKKSFGTDVGIIWKEDISSDDMNILVPERDALLGNFPNPFNPQSTIYYALSEPKHVKLIVLNVLGQEVITLVDGYQDAGYKSVEFNAGSLASGIYFYRMTAQQVESSTGNFSDIKKMLLVR